MQPEQSAAVNAIDAGAVMEYLTCHPDFFDANPDFLSRLRVPHDSGSAVSLVEKQVSVLRSKCNRLESSLHDLISVARDNESLQKRLHVLVQEVISAKDVDAVLTLAGASFKDNFKASDTRLLIFDKTAKRRAASRVAADHPFIADAAKKPVTEATIAVFDPVLASAETRCGLPTPEQLSALVGEDHTEVASAALIPLAHEGRLGVMMLASSDAERFSNGKGVMFLDQLGQVISRKLHSLGVKAV